MDTVQPEEERERQDAGSSEPHRGHEDVQPSPSASLHAPQGEEEQKKEQRFGVADLEHRSQRSAGEERHRPHR
ncbi:hypothetical protein, partial [Pseudomonas aeruginosa]|uniref:hypothetical protein n=1 Tax=Pseudomonas aeruginosa TaxID=287 RepID=UPI002B40E7DB